MTAPAHLLISRCSSCHSRFLPRRGPCPRCGSAQVEPVEIPAQAAVLAATELSVPPPGWPRPHRLAILEAVDGVRLLAVVDGPLPLPGQMMTIGRDGETYRASPLGVPTVAGAQRDAGRGSLREPGPTRPPFEPPR